MLRWILCAAALLLAQVPVAQAATLFTGPVKANNGEALECGVANVSAAARDVSLQLFDANGAEANDESCMPLQPGRVCRTGVSANATIRIYCKITVDGGKKTVRGTMQNSTSGISSDAH